MRADRSASRRDAWVTVAAFVGLVAWDASGLDLELTRWIATPTGFPWRDSFLASRVLHDGGRAFGWVIFALLAFDAFRPQLAGPTRGERLHALGTVLVAVVLVPMLRRFSSTSCPWELAEFGGRSAYVPHWLLGVTDGGPGHCFPSGHAVAAFAFFGVYFLWRRHRPAVARAALAVVLALGIAFGWAQWARGAHYVSHTLWSAWLCWVIGALAFGLHPATRVAANADAAGPAP